MTDHKKISLALEKLMTSKTFAKSGLYRDLLHYLVNSSLKGEVPKEQQIAFDVFRKKADQDKELNVRVYILNLRNKLKEYYLNEGRDDTVMLHIPKGKYQVEFRFLTYKSFKKRIERYSVPIFLAGLFLVVISVVLLSNPGKFRQPDQKIWKGFLEPGYPILIVLGDHYFFSDSIATGKWGIARDTKINSDEDLDAYLKLHPELMDNIRKNKTTYINNQAPIGLYRIMKMFGGGIAPVEMKYSSQLQWDELRNKHLIFIGSVKTLQFLKTTLERIGLRYDLDHNSFAYQSGDSTLYFENRSGNFPAHEYSSLIHFCTKDGRKVLFLISDADLGNIAAMKFLTEEQTTDFPEKQVGENYKAVFEVTGAGLTEFTVGLKRIDAIRTDIDEIWP